MFRAGLLLLSAFGASADRKIPNKHQGHLGTAHDATDATSLTLWDNASWIDPCWGEPDPEQQLSGEVLASICARLHQNASFLVFGLGRDSTLWFKNAGPGKIVFLENHEDWLKFQEKEVVDATRMVKYTSDAMKYKQELHDESSLDTFYESLPDDIKEARWDMILVDSPMGMETNSLPDWMNRLGASVLLPLHPTPGTPGRVQSVYAAKRLAGKGALVYVDDFHRTVEHESAKVLLESHFRMLKVFSSGHRDNNGIMGDTAMFAHESQLMR